MRIFGIKGCNEIRRNRVVIFFCDNGEPLTIGEQMTEKEAEELYSRTLDKFNDKNKIIEIEHDNKINAIVKDNIILIQNKKE